MHKIPLLAVSQGHPVAISIRDRATLTKMGCSRCILYGKIAVAILPYGLARHVLDYQYAVLVTSRLMPPLVHPLSSN